MYAYETTDEYEKRFKKWEKRHRRELAGMLENLRTVKSALDRGARVQDLHFGFLHPEPSDLKAVDQGGGCGLRESRLYFYVDEDREIMKLLTLGSKETQSDDIANCVYYIQNEYSDSQKPEQ